MHRAINPKGSALITVIMLIAIMAILTASMLKYSGSEERSNVRQRLILRSRNMTENVALYASEQITNKLYRLRSNSPMAFLGANGIALPPADVLTTSFSQPADVEARAGLTTTSGLVYIDPTLPANAGNPNAGLQVSNSIVPIIAKSTMHQPSIGDVHTYAEQDLEISMMPLFQFAVFYNMDMEFGPGPNMTISGPVHTNGDLIARIQTGFANTLRFTDRVTSAKGFYADTAHKGGTYMSNGGVDNGPGGTGPLLFQNPAGTTTDIRSSAGIWRDQKWTSSSTPGTVAETATSQNNFRTFATTAYGGNLRTALHGVTKLVLPDIGDYDENDPVKRLNGRQVIEVPDSSDAGGVLGTKFSRNAGLYIIANPDASDRAGHLPDGTMVTMRARSYRAWLNRVNADGSHTLSEVILPGQPSYGALNACVNNLPNAYRVNTSVGANQVLRIPQATGATVVDLADTGYGGSAIPVFPTLADSYFYDMRRGFNQTGYPWARSAANSFRPRPIAKIDFDLTRFKMAVERTLLGNTTSSVYYPAYPCDATTWGASILNPAAVPAVFGLGLAPGTNNAFSIFPAEDKVTVIQRSATGAYAPAAVRITSSTQAGVAAVAAYTGSFTIEESTATPTAAGVYTWGAPVITTGAAQISYTPSTTGVTAVRIRQYFESAAATTLLDEQIIPVVNADAPTTTVTAALTNDRCILPCNGATVDYTKEPVADMKVYVGGVDDTANWTFSVAAPTNLTGNLGGNAASTAAQTGNGLFENRYTVTAISANTGSVVITASKTGYNPVSRTFSLVKQSSLTGGAAAVASTGYWVNAGNQQAPDPFRIYFAPADPADPNILSSPVTFAVTAGDLVLNSSSPSPWFDGVTIYIESVNAENLTESGTNNAAVRNRVSSGVRLWNGRGPLISLSAATYPGRTGLSFATNDAAYIVGHYNADGTTNATLTSTGTGGYSGRYPESTSEMLTSVMADAITILSQPEATRAGTSPAYYYYQSSGWADSMSASMRDGTAAYSTSWASSNPSSSNTLDGTSTSIKPALLPNLTVLSSDVGPGPRPAPTLPSASPGATTIAVASRTFKFAPSETEISTCLLTGIVPTTVAAGGATGQTSGGVHNFPRLLENWAGAVALYIRGSLVAMFESQVATEPWSIRYYQGAIRNWGLHESLRNANHDVPLEPIVLGARRMSYRELNQAGYDSMKSTIEALPH